MRRTTSDYTLGGMHTKTLRNVVLVAVAALAALTLSACAGGASFQTVDAATFAGEIAKPGVTVLDVRTPAEFASGHIEGAVNIDVQEGFQDAIASLDKTKTYAVYCHSGNRSALASQQMADAGFTSIYNLDGGIVLWQANGYQLVQ